MKKFILILLAAFLIISITKVLTHYTEKPTKMIYYLKENETVQQVAVRFNINETDIKEDGRYLMFYVR